MSGVLDVSGLLGGLLGSLLNDHGRGGRIITGGRVAVTGRIPVWGWGWRILAWVTWGRGRIAVRWLLQGWGAVIVLFFHVTASIVWYSRVGGTRRVVGRVVGSSRVGARVVGSNRVVVTLGRVSAFGESESIRDRPLK